MTSRGVQIPLDRVVEVVLEKPLEGQSAEEEEADIVHGPAGHVLVCKDGGGHVGSAAGRAPATPPRRAGTAAAVGVVANAAVGENSRSGGGKTNASEFGDGAARATA